MLCLFFTFTKKELLSKEKRNGTGERERKREIFKEKVKTQVYICGLP